MVYLSFNPWFVGSLDKNLYYILSYNLFNDVSILGLLDHWIRIICCIVIILLLSSVSILGLLDHWIRIQPEKKQSRERSSFNPWFVGSLDKNISSSFSKSYSFAVSILGLLDHWIRICE